MNLGRRESEGDLASSPMESQRGWSSRLSSRGQSRLGFSQAPQAFTTWSELTLGSQAWGRATLSLLQESPPIHREGKGFLSRSQIPERTLET